MEKTMLMCRSMTRAQRAQRLLERRGILSSVVKAPVGLTKTGCGYALILRRHAPEAIRLLKEQDLFDGKVYQLQEDVWIEVSHDLS